MDRSSGVGTKVTNVTRERYRRLEILDEKVFVVGRKERSWSGLLWFFAIRSVHE
jgi:hypothetical protein